MRLLSGKKGMTFIEVLLTSTYVTFVMLAIVNLMIYIYRGTVATNEKTASYTLATEKLELLKQVGFGPLQVTDDTCITTFDSPDLNLLTTCGVNNPYPPEQVLVEGVTYTVYKIVMYGQEDTSTGSIVPVKQADLANGTGTSLIKVAKVIVTYNPSPNDMRSSQIMTMIASKDIMMSGIKISGWVSNKDFSQGNSNPTPPGHSAYAQVFVEGHPEYTSAVVDANGLYTIYNVLPGTYNLYSEGVDGSFTRGYYAGNPLVVSATSGDMSNIDIICGKVDPAFITGMVTYNSCNPQNQITPEPNVVILANDGLSSMSTSSNSLSSNFSIGPVNAGSGNSQDITVSFFQAAPGATPGFAQAVVSCQHGKTSTVCVQMTPGSGSMGIVTFKTLNAVDRTSNVSNVTVQLGSSYIGTSNGTGDLTISGITPGSYSLSASAPNYTVESAPLPDLNVFAGTNPVVKIYLYPVGKISGTIRDNTSSNPVPNIAVKVISNYGAGKTVTEAFSDTMGVYVAQNIPVTGSGEYMVKPYLDGTPWGCVSPGSGYYNNVNVSQGTTTANKDFNLNITYVNITGTVSMPECDNRNVLIIAEPSSNTQDPHSFVETSSGDFHDGITNYVRLKYPFYSVEAGQDGKFVLQAPGNSTINIYVYYNYISLTGSPDKPTRTMVKYYKKISNISTGTTGSNLNITTGNGAWTSY